MEDAVGLDCSSECVIESESINRDALFTLGERRRCGGGLGRRSLGAAGMSRDATRFRCGTSPPPARSTHLGFRRPLLSSQRRAMLIRKMDPPPLAESNSAVT